MNTQSLCYSLIGILLLSITSCGTDTVLDPHPCDFPEALEAYSLVWSDEFEGNEIDEQNWSFQIGDGCAEGICGWGNNEKQYYTNRRSNVRTTDGNLIIQAIKENTPFEGYDYTSARLNSRNKVDLRFGRVEVRARLPKGKGLWPAIWMLPTAEKFGDWPRSGEIDIMELVGDKPREILGTVHYGIDFANRDFRSSFYELESGDFSDDFHTFSLLWRENCIRFMVDGEIYGKGITPSQTLPAGYPFNEDFHFILNVAVGGNLPGDPDGSTTFPQQMVVDYVRVYKEN